MQIKLHDRAAYIPFNGFRPLRLQHRIPRAAIVLCHIPMSGQDITVSVTSITQCSFTLRLVSVLHMLSPWGPILILHFGPCVWVELFLLVILGMDLWFRFLRQRSGCPWPCHGKWLSNGHVSLFLGLLEEKHTVFFGFEPTKSGLWWWCQLSSASRNLSLKLIK